MLSGRLLRRKRFATCLGALVSVLVERSGLGTMIGINRHVLLGMSSRSHPSLGGHVLLLAWHYRLSPLCRMGWQDGGSLSFWLVRPHWVASQAICMDTSRVLRSTCSLVRCISTWLTRCCSYLLTAVLTVLMCGCSGFLSLYLALGALSGPSISMLGRR